MLGCTHCASPYCGTRSTVPVTPPPWQAKAARERLVKMEEEAKAAAAKKGSKKPPAKGKEVVEEVEAEPETEEERIAREKQELRD